ncbi:hypothetical protein [Caballeronia sordidicola]|uniref:hypothetical protein n=1 Tax=Caballeronia sordidicola TaxID=196367 RepID=UPI00118053BD|nr:hypothetical protein [Caballeronia sordidicola]
MSFDQTFQTAPRHPLLVEQEIAHLERIVPRWSDERRGSLLGQAYWRKRVIDLARYPELTPTQHATVQRMLECVNTVV